MDQHYSLPWVRLMNTMRQAHPSGTKPRDYPNAPQVKAFTMDFSPGYDVGMSRYALMEGNHYDTGFSPFEPDEIFYDTDQNDKDHHIYLNHFAKGEHIRPKSFLEGEYARSFGHEFAVKTEPRHHLAKGHTSASDYDTPTEADEAIRDLMNRGDYDPRSESYYKEVRKTTNQMLDFFNHKGIPNREHTPAGLKSKLKEMGLTADYEQYVRDKRASGSRH